IQSGMKALLSLRALALNAGRDARAPRVGSHPNERRIKSEWDVPVLLRRVGVALVFEERERAYELRARLRGLDYLVDEAALGRDVRVRELLLELGDARATRGLLVRRLRNLPPV